MTSEPGRHGRPDRQPVLDDLSSEARSGPLLGYMSLLGVTAAVVFAAVGALVGIAFHDPGLFALYGFFLGTLVSAVWLTIVAFNDGRRSGGNGWWNWR